MKNNIIQQKSYQFAVSIVKLCKELQEDKKEYIISRQLLKAGTSIGANVEEAIGGHSRKDFFAKLTISYKEARETRYWLRLLNDTEYISQEKASLFINKCDELLRIIGSIQRTTKLKGL